MRRQYASGPLFHLFDFDHKTTSVDNLPNGLIVNGVEVFPSFQFNAIDADVSNWRSRYGNVSMGIVSTGTDVSPFGTPLLGDRDTSLYFPGGKYFQAPTGNTTFGNIGTNDLVIEYFGRIDAGSQCILSKSNEVGNRYGYMLSMSATATLQLLLGVNGTTTTVSSTARGGWVHFHAMIFVNRDENSTSGAQIYINGKASGSGVNFYTTRNSCDASVELAIGAKYNAATKFTGTVGFLNMWNYPGWFKAGAAGPTEWATVAIERFYRLMGLYPSKAGGTYMPVSFTRTNSASWSSTMDKLEKDGTRKIYFVSDDFPRIVKRPDKTGKTITGYLSEPTITSASPPGYSVTPSYWTLSRCTFPVDTIVVIDGQSRPNLLLHEDSSNNTHNIATPSFTHSAGYSMCISVFFKAFVRTWGWIGFYIPGVGTSVVYFDLTSGTVQSGWSTSYFSDADIEYWGDGWYRCWVVTKVRAAAVSCTASFGSGVNGYYIYQGVTDTHAIGLYGMQVENGTYPSSFILTYNSSYQSHTGDTLYYTASDGNVGFQMGSIGTSVLVPVRDRTPPGICTNQYIFSISNGAAVTDSTSLWVSAGIASPQSSAFDIYSGAVEISTVSGTTIDLANGCATDIYVNWESGASRQYINRYTDGTFGTPTTFPATMDRINIGCDYAGARQLGGVINNIKIYGDVRDTDVDFK